MMNTECSICLSTIHEKDKYILSCNHTFHKDCYYKCVYSNNMNGFIKCPLCREMNFNITIDNLTDIIKTDRCKCITKNGTRCKNKSYILNYGMCYTHHKNILPKQKFNIMKILIKWLIETPTSYKTKISVIDICKQLFIKNTNIEKLEDILHYIYRFHAYSNERIVNKQLMYEYYDLDRPGDDWVMKCYDNKIII